MVACSELFLPIRIPYHSVRGINHHIGKGKRAIIKVAAGILDLILAYHNAIYNKGTTAH